MNRPPSRPPAECGHRQVEHTADLAFELWGPDEASVLRQGARAVVETLTEQAAIPRADTRHVELEAFDAADRLVRWLNEVLYLATVEGFVVSDAELVLHDEGLQAELVGLADAAHLLQTEIKSATYHDLVLEHREGKVFARVVLDV
jgi:SHS2 domain-containing protein